MPERHPLLDVLIVVLLLMMSTGLPRQVPGVRAVERRIEPMFDVIGLEQSTWQLFAPEPDHVNAWVEATVIFSDGSTATWTTPRWRDRTLVEKFVQGRLPKILDYVRRDDWKILWQPFAAWVLTQVPAPGPDAHPVEVRLTRHWWTIPPPHRVERVVRRHGAFPLEREQYPGTAEYFVWEVPPRLRQVHR